MWNPSLPGHRMSAAASAAAVPSDAALIAAAAAKAVISCAACESSQYRAARLIQERWLDRRNGRLIAATLAKQQAFDEYLQRREEARQQFRDEQLQKLTLFGVSDRIWPIIREVAAILCAAVLLAVFAPAAFEALPEPFDVKDDAPPLEQTRAALTGAAVAVSAFTAFFLVLVLLYIQRWERLLYTLHSLWIGSLLGGPLYLLLTRCCNALNVPLDAMTTVFVVWNVVTPGVILVHWSATVDSFAAGRRCYAALLATLCAWLLASVPYQTAVTALLMLAVLDVLLVLLPGAPVQKLDAVATERRRSGERQMPGLTFKAEGLELGLGDFIVFPAFAAHATKVGVAPLTVICVGVLVGLVHTMATIALKRGRTVLPALPLSIALGAFLLAAERWLVHPLACTLAEAKVWL